MESPSGNNRQYHTSNPAKRDKYVNEFAFCRKANSNLLKIDAEQAIGFDPRMEWIYENIKYMEF